MDRIANFLFEVGMLKRTPRTGWQFLAGADRRERRGSFLSGRHDRLCSRALEGRGIDADRLLRLALVHDLPEARTSDLNYVNQKYVQVDEQRAAADMVDGLPFADELDALLEEYRTEETRESIVAHDADQLELLLQLVEQRTPGYRPPKIGCPLSSNDCEAKVAAASPSRSSTATVPDGGSTVTPTGGFVVARVDATGIDRRSVEQNPGRSGQNRRLRDNAAVKMTPMLRQYLDLKAQAGTALLLYRMGDFYELFFEDAQIAAPILGVVLTKRRHNENVEAPMCGVPHHAIGSYIGKLLDAGFRVAVAEQVEDPATAKGLVRREIVRTHTPGTVSETDLLDGSERCYLAAYGDDGESLALAWIEVSTGTFEGLRCDNPRVLTEHLAQIRPRELLVAEGWDDWKNLWPADLEVPTLSPMEPNLFSPSAGEQRLKRVLRVGSLRGFGLESGEKLVGMAGALLGYIESTQKGALHHLRRFVRRSPGDALIIDRASLRNLEIEQAADGSRSTSLVAVLDHTATRMGSRLLRDWITIPSIDIEEIGERQRAVAELVEDSGLLTATGSALDGIPDLERLAGRVGMALATPRELASLRAALDMLPALAGAAGQATSPRMQPTRGRSRPPDRCPGYPPHPARRRAASRGRPRSHRDGLGQRTR